jgi:hypothetical protein
LSDGDAAILVEGDVMGQPFSATAGTAERLQSGSYILTLSNSPSFSCTSEPQSASLSVVIDGFSGSGEYPAADSVSFSSIEDGVIDGEAATSGRVFVDVGEESSPGMISGDINASGPTSQVNGTFEVPVCP